MPRKPRDPAPVEPTAPAPQVAKPEPKTRKKREPVSTRNVSHSRLKQPATPRVRKGGRPKYVITNDDIDQIRAYAMVGMSMSEIATLLEISEGTFSTWNKIPEVMEAMKTGRVRSLVTVGNALYKKAIAGDLGSIVWFEKTRGRRSDRVVVVNEDDADRITRSIKGLSVDQLKRLSDGEHPESVLGGDA